MYTRRKSKEVKIGNTVIGGSNPIAVQSMLNTPAHDADACVEQALRLEKAGCEIIRTAVPDTDCVKTVYKLKENLKIPVVADIHFDYKIALECAEAGADKIRINPGNIGSDDRVKLVADKCRQKNIPIRIGVNSGSLEKDILKKYGSPTAAALAESAMYHAGLLEKFDFDNIVISLKSSDVFRSYEAYSIISEKCNYPLHIGITEAGTERMGIIKSSAGLGALLISGIGDTIRISLTADPEKEIDAAYDLLKALNLRTRGIKFISCPTCGRTKIDLIKIASQAEERLKNCDKDITVAVMGCIVNGPGEAKEADIGIAGGDGNGLIFKKGEILRKVPEDRLIDELVYEIENTNFDE
ncbi:MAG: flavodoxin-dependent (E)-4-hydroxy-3-methylbut-2-enyl-diphosphate synthase [Clostridiales bacterium]|nr:flavodoxin-dependent (E)-4-hydroxy-3-methylbut-2-enyl-diphosphate synthase [Clostridiales bacterium]